MGITEWAIVAAVLLGVIAILVVAARWRQKRYDNIAPGNLLDEDLPDMPNSELPSGGARTVGYREVEDLAQLNLELRERKNPIKPPAVGDLETNNKHGDHGDAARETNVGGGNNQPYSKASKPGVKAKNQQSVTQEEQVPLLLEPSDEHNDFDKADDVANGAVSDSKPSHTRALEPHKSPKKTAAQKKGKSKRQEPSISPGDIEDMAQEGKQSQAINPTVDDSKQNTDSRSQADTDEVIVVNLMREASDPYEGSELKRTVEELGFRFGDMDIFHYCGRHGNQPEQFHMANLVSPGVFDINDMASIRTHALCFFFTLDANRKNLQTYDTMLSVINKIREELGGELRDEHRSVFTIQTREHGRQRIQEFQRRIKLNQ